MSFHMIDETILSNVFDILDGANTVTDSTDTIDMTCTPRHIIFVPLAYLLRFASFGILAVGYGLTVYP